MKTRHSILFLFAVFSFVFAIPSFAQEEDFREWKSSGGTFSIRAQFVELKDGQVTLRKEDGKTISVDLSKLSEADQKFVSDNGDVPSPGKRAKSSGEMDYRELEVIEIKKAIPWSLTPSTKPASPTLSEPASHELSQRNLVPFDVTLLPNPSGTYLMLCGRSFQSNVATGSLLDLSTGKLAQSVLTLDYDNFKPFAMTEDMKSLFGSFRMRGQHRVVWLKATGKSIREQLVWQAGPDFIQDFVLARFIDDTHLITGDDKGAISLWDLGQRKLVWQTQARRRSAPALSNDLKYVVAYNDQFIFAIEVLTGEVVGSFPFQTTNFPVSIGFRPDGSEIIIMSNGIATRINSTNAEQIDRFNLGLGRANILGWMDDETFLTEGGDIIDLRLRGRIGGYQGASGDAQTLDGNGHLWTLIRSTKDKPENEGKPMKNGETRAMDNVFTLIGTRTPHPSLQQWREQISNDDEFVVVKKGDSVNLKVYARAYNATQDQRDRIKKELEAELSQTSRPATRSPRSMSSPTQPGDSTGAKSVLDEETKRRVNALKGMVLEQVDVTDRATEIARQLVADAGFSISSSAPYTLHIEIGRETDLTGLENRKEMRSSNQLDPLWPHSLTMHYFVTNQSNEVIWKSSTVGYATHLSDAKFDTTKPDAVEMLLDLQIPNTIVNIPFRPDATITLEGVKEIDAYK